MYSPSSLLSSLVERVESVHLAKFPYRVDTIKIVLILVDVVSSSRYSIKSIIFEIRSSYITLISPSKGEGHLERNKTQKFSEQHPTSV